MEARRDSEREDAADRAQQGGALDAAPDRLEADRRKHGVYAEGGGGEAPLLPPRIEQQAVAERGVAVVVVEGLGGDERIDGAVTAAVAVVPKRRLPVEPAV